MSTSKLGGRFPVRSKAIHVACCLCAALTAPKRESIFRVLTEHPALIKAAPPEHPGLQDISLNRPRLSLLEVEKNWLLLQEWAFKVSCVASGEEPGLTPWADAVEKVVRQLFLGQAMTAGF